jgi:hypothetical protein
MYNSPLLAPTTILTPLAPQGADGSRQPTAKELELANVHGKSFYEAVSKVNFA